MKFLINAFSYFAFFYLHEQNELFLGIIGNIPQKIKDIFESKKNELQEVFYSEKYILAFGEKNERFSYNIDSEKVEVLLGIPIQIDLNKAENLNIRTFFQLNSFENVNGHYAAFEIKEDKCFFYTDTLGIRSIYVVQDSKYIIFSSRIDLLATYLDKMELNSTAIYSLWNFHNQIGNSALFKNVIRINKGNKAEFSFASNIFKYNKYQYITSNTQYSFEEYDLLTKNFFTNVSIQNKNKYLALSGGLDSRYILSLLKKHGVNKFRAFTNGDKKHPDFEVSAKICKELELEHIAFESSEIIKPSQLTEYIIQTNATYPITDFLQLTENEFLKNDENAIFDGVFVSVLKQTMGNKLLLLGKNDLEKKNYSEILDYFKKDNADILEIENTKLTINELIETLAEFDKYININDKLTNRYWVDRFLYEYRLSNFFGIEISRLDSYFANYSLGLQKFLFDSYFNFNAQELQNSRLMKNSIKSNLPEINNIPLVRGNTTIPISYGNMSAILLQLLKSKLGMQYKNQYKANLLMKNKDFLISEIEKANKQSSYLKNNQALTILNNFHRNPDLEWSQFDKLATLSIFLNYYRI